MQNSRVEVKHSKKIFCSECHNVMLLWRYQVVKSFSFAVNYRYCTGKKTVIFHFFYICTQKSIWGRLSQFSTKVIGKNLNFLVWTFRFAAREQFFADSKVKRKDTKIFRPTGKILYQSRCDFGFGRKSSMFRIL